MVVAPFHLNKTILIISYTHRNVKVFTATVKIKVRLFEDSAAEIFVQQNVHNTTTKIMKTLFFKEFYFQHVLILIVNSLCLTKKV